MRNIINAAPQVVVLNTADSSTRDTSSIPEQYPQHIPKIFGWAKKGPLSPQLVESTSRNNIYGTETFDLNSKYATHQTLLANRMTRKGNPFMYQRIIPEDAGPNANVTLWLDVLETTVDLYEREDDGRIKVDTNGDPIVTGTTTGYKVKYVVTNESTETGFTSIGNRSPLNGDQTDGTNQSTRYPIFEAVYNSRTEDGNNVGFRLWAYGGNSRTIPTNLMIEERTYPFNFNIIRRENSRSQPTVTTTILNERDVTLTFKPNAIDPDTNMNMYVGNVIENQYTDTKTAGFPPVYGDFERVYIYDSVIANLLEDFHQAEIPYIDNNTDFSAEAEDKYLFNFIGGFNSNGSPYSTYQFTDDVTGVKLSEYTNVFCGGGSDGTLSYDDWEKEDPDNPGNMLTMKGFNSLVTDQLLRYADLDDELMEMAIHVESTLWDTGFPLDVKEEFSNFIMHRPDTWVMLTTQVFGVRSFSLAEEQSVGIALRTRFEMQPESDYFGTPVMRAVIMGGDAKSRIENWPHRVPVLLDLADKVAAYMGSSTGDWQSGKAFDDPESGDSRTVNTIYDISTPYMSALTRARRWDIGVNWVQPENRDEYFYPGIKTLYSNDTSVLTSFPTMAAICYINKVTQETWRRFTGNATLEPEEMVEKVNDFVTGRVVGRFDGRFVIKPDAHFTSADELRGYSWTLPVKLYANNMKTVMTTYVRAFRRSDLDAS